MHDLPFKVQYVGVEASMLLRNAAVREKEEASTVRMYVRMYVSSFASQCLPKKSAVTGKKKNQGYVTNRSSMVSHCPTELGPKLLNCSDRTGTGVASLV